MLWVQAGRVLGRTLLEIDASTRPALFVPTAESCVQLQTRTALGDVTPDTFLLALSLVCNQRVSLAWGWNDHGDASAFSTGGSGTLLGTGTRTVSGWSRDPSTGITKLASKVPPPNLDETGLQRAWALRRELQKRIGSDQRFQIAVDRWARAATPGDLKPDRLIDLRIALEALYVDSDQGELGFRLSVTGARHLRTSLNERRAVKKKLTQFYRLASKTIHAGTSSKDVALVGDVTTLCRDGILKMVEERNQPDWTDVLLS